MMVRLAFAVQMAVEPTLFIIDEALAVGDIYFQNKCNRILKQKLDDGMTLLLVSHSPASVRALCQTGLVLDRGRRMFFGPSDEAVNIYHALGSARREVGLDSAEELYAPLAETAAQQRAAHPLIPQGLGQIQDEIGTREILVTGCALFDAAGTPCREFAPGEPIRAGFTFRSRLDVADVLVGFAIRDKFNNVVTARTNVNQGLEPLSLRAGCLYAVFLTLAGRLGQGEYLLDFGLGSLPNAAGSPTAVYHRIGGIAAFSVSWGGQHVAFQGICDLCTDFSDVEVVQAAD
ncbi:MAG: Wzt carbohydrate-binding domain-containing protein [Gluconacetobacter diazotrophicus]|nr:Wzt carbohydrate-binding domain-containing protein [Gluconacetobacter diazotrophicus]